MPTHEITYTSTKVPADLPKGATVREVSPYPIVFERRGSALELFRVPDNEATIGSGVVAAIHVNGEHVELTEEAAKKLARDLVQLARARGELVAKRKSEAEQKAIQEQAEAARRRLAVLLNVHADPYALRRGYRNPLFR